MSNCSCNCNKDKDNTKRREELVYLVKRYNDLAQLQKSRNEYDSASQYKADADRYQNELNNLK